MANPFDQFDAPTTAAAASSAASPVSGPVNPFDRFDAPSAPAPVDRNAINWSRYNQPFGELKPADVSPTQSAKWAAQDALIGLGASPYNAGKLGGAAVDLGKFNPVAGGTLSAADMGWNVGGGHYMDAAIDATGLIPGAVAARRLIKGVPTVAMADVPRGVRDPSFLPERGSSGPPPVPVDELQEAGNAAYKRTATNPTQYHPLSMPDYIGKTVRELRQVGAHGSPHIPENSPEFYNLMQRWNANALASSDPITAAQWDALRQELRNLPPGGSGVAGGKAAERLDNYMANPPSGAVVQGTPADLDALRRDLAEGRGNWRAYKTAKTVEDQLTNRTSAAVSRRQDTGDAARETLNYLANTKAGQNAIWGANAGERAAIRAGAEGTGGTRLTHNIADALGGGWAASIGGSAAGGTAHLLGMDPVSAAAIGAAGAATPKAISLPFKKAASNAAQDSAQGVIEQIRKNSPLYAQRSAAPGTPGRALMVPGSPVPYAPAAGTPPIADPMAMRRDAIAYALIPQLREAGTNAWDRAHVPYANRGESYDPTLEQP